MKLHVGNPPIRIETGGRYKLTERVFHWDKKESARSRSSFVNV